ncbi:hypothetical protein D3C85_209240 [compost metagenome]
MSLAVFRDHGDTGFHRCLRRGQGGRCFAVAKEHVTGVGTVGAEDQAQQFRAARADQAGDAEDFAGTQVERGRVDDLAARQATHAQQRCAQRAAAQVDGIIGRAAHHQADQIGGRVARDIVVAHELAVAQHGDAVGHALEFFQAVGNIDDAHAFGFQAFDLQEQQLHFAVRQHGRRLVEHQQAAGADQIARDFDHLLVADAQFAHEGPRIEAAQAHFFHLFTRVAFEARTVDKAETLRQIFQVQVFRDRQGGNQIEFLHHHADAQRLGGAARGGLIGLAVEQHRARGGLLQAADDLRQGALASTVFARQRQHLAGGKAQAHAAQHGADIGLADVIQGQ